MIQAAGTQQPGSCFASCVGDKLDGFALIGPCSDDDLGSSTRQLDSNGLVDATRTAGDQRDASLMRSIESR